MRLVMMFEGLPAKCKPGASEAVGSEAADNEIVERMADLLDTALPGLHCAQQVSSKAELEACR